MQVLKNISIRGRMAYTKIQYLDDWMYEVAEYMPDSILEDAMEDAEYITEKEFRYLYKLYSDSNKIYLT